mgnify:CR=1 FL=1
MDRLFYFAVVVLMSAQGCKKDGCNDPLAFNYDPEGTSVEACVWEPVPVEVSFTTSYGDVAVTSGANPTRLTTDDGRSLQIDYFGVYLTEMAFVVDGKAGLLGNGTNDCVEREQDAHLMLESDRTYTGSFLPNADANVTAIRFNVGVDSCRNVGLDPSTKLSGPFAPKSPTMYWSWASGYRFVTIEGMVDASASADGSDLQKFEYHTGMNALLRTVEIPMEELTVEDGKVIVHLNLDFKQVLSNVDFTAELVTHTMDNMPLAMKITENTKEAFTLD